MRRRIGIYRSPRYRRESIRRSPVRAELEPCVHVELRLRPERIEIPIRDLLPERFALFDDPIDLAFAGLVIDDLTEG